MKGSPWLKWVVNRVSTATATDVNDNIIFSGDSQTQITEWVPRFLQRIYGTPTYHNVAVSGKALRSLLVDDITRVDSLYIPGARNSVFIWAGTNDLSLGPNSGGSDAATLYANTIAYCNARRAAGATAVFVGTIMPRNNASDPTFYEEQRNIFNIALRADHSFADGLIDCALDARLGAVGANLNTTFIGDGVHLAPLGAEVFAGIAAQTWRKYKNSL